MTCPRCRPDLYPDCKYPLVEGHLAMRWWQPSDYQRWDPVSTLSNPPVDSAFMLAFSNTHRFRFWFNGEEVWSVMEACPGPCGFLVAIRTTRKMREQLYGLKYADSVDGGSLEGPYPCECNYADKKLRAESAYMTEFAKIPEVEREKTYQHYLCVGKVAISIVPREKDRDERGFKGMKRS